MGSGSPLALPTQAELLLAGWGNAPAVRTVGGISGVPNHCLSLVWVKCGWPQRPGELKTYALGSPNLGTNSFSIPWQGRGRPKRGETLMASTIAPGDPTGDASGTFFSLWVQCWCLPVMGLLRFRALFTAYLVYYDSFD